MEGDDWRGEEGGVSISTRRGIEKLDAGRRLTSIWMTQRRCIRLCSSKVEFEKEVFGEGLVWVEGILDSV